MNQKPILLLQTGDAPPFIVERCGNFDKMFYREAGLAGRDVVTVHAARGERPGRLSSYRAIIVTGSPAMVSDREAWSEDAAEWLLRAMDAGVSIFAVCYGHQLLAHALGGRVGYHPQGEEVGTFRIEVNEAGKAHPLLSKTPSDFPANLAHSQTVLEPPPGARVLAFSRHDPYQMLEYAPDVVSVQFHPEFDRGTIAAYAEMTGREKPEKTDFYRDMITRASETPEARDILRRFVALVS